MAEIPEFPRILTDEQRTLLQEDRSILSDLQAALARFGGSPEDEKRVKTALERLEDLFLLVVAGEFNAGKSAVLNALVGEKVLAEGPTPTTERIHLLVHSNRADHVSPEPGIARVTADAPVLTHMNVVDTPGTNAVLREHEAITRDFIPRADLVLFVTSADRPFTESERSFLEAIRDWGKKVVIVVNKIDIVHQAQDAERIEAFVLEKAQELLGFAPAVFPVSARRALEAKQGDGNEELWRQSRFQGLEVYVVQTLDEAERVRLKLISPLKVGLRVTERYLEVAQEREDLLAADFEALEELERQLDVYREDMHRDLGFRLSDVEKIFTDFERRGLEFFEETLRVGRLPDLIRRRRISEEFERKVVADLPQQVDDKVRDLLDWRVERDLEFWTAVSEQVARRRAEHADRIVGKEGKSFDLNRKRMLDDVHRAARTALAGYDRKREAERLAEQAQLAAAGAALLEAGAVGVGAAVALTALDATGLLAAGTLAVLGLAVLPIRRRQAESNLREKVDEMRGRVVRSLREELDREIDRSVEAIRDAIAPYTRFVRAERERLDAMRAELDAIRRRGVDLTSQIEAM